MGEKEYVDYPGAAVMASKQAPEENLRDVLRNCSQIVDEIEAKLFPAEPMLDGEVSVDTSISMLINLAGVLRARLGKINREVNRING